MEDEAVEVAENHKPNEERHSFTPFFARVSGQRKEKISRLIGLEITL
jgi:uncharacterized membrane protein